MVTIKRVIGSKAVTWLSRNLSGNVVLGWLFIGLPTFLVFTYQSHVQGILSSDRIVDLLFITSLESGVFGLIMWFAVIKPMLNRKSRR